MRVSRLEIFGFKSFVDKFVLNFDHNIIGVVGPNGCGKSNIVDALRWVLGESHAKQLRGSQLEDLIFNGSDSRRALGMAEVSITIRPDEDWFRSFSTKIEELDDLELAEENSKLLVEGSAKPELSIIDGEKQFANDQSDTFHKADLKLVTNSDQLDAENDGTGSDLNSATNNGSNYNQAGNQHNNQHSNKHSALQPRIASPLLDIPGLFESAELQLTRRLYRSGESEYFINRVPCRLRDMVDLYRVIGLGARGLSIVAQGSVGQLVTKKPTEIRELIEEAAGISGFRSRMEAAERRLDTTSNNLLRLRDIKDEVEKQLKSLRKQAKRAENRAELKSKLKDSEFNLFALKRDRLVNQIETSNVILEQESKLVENHRAQIEELEQKEINFKDILDQTERQIQQLRNKREEIQAVLTHASTKETELKLKLAQIDGRREAIKSAKDKIVQRENSFLEQRERSESAINELNNSLKLLEADRQVAEESLRAIQQNITESTTLSSPQDQDRIAEMQNAEERLNYKKSLQEDLAKFEEIKSAKDIEFSKISKELSEKRIKAAAIESEVRSLKAQLDALAESASKEVLGELKSDGTTKYSVALSALNVPETYQKAVSAILGERGNYLLAKNSADIAERYVNEGRSSDKKRIGVIESGLYSQQKATISIEELQFAPSAKILIDELSIQDNAYGSFSHIFAGVVVVDNVAQAAELHKKREKGDARIFVTLSGEVFAPWGWFTTEGKGAVFGFTRKISELEKLHLQLVEEQSDTERRLSLIESEVEEVNGKIITHRSEIKALAFYELRLEELKREQLKAEQERRNILIQEERKAQQELTAVISKITNTQTLIQSEQRQIEYREKEKLKLTLEIGQLENDSQKLVEEEQVVKMSIGELELRRADAVSAQKEIGVISESITNAEQQRKEANQSFSNYREDISKLRKEYQLSTDKINNLQREIDRSDLELNLAREDFLRFYPEVEIIEEISFDSTTFESVLSSFNIAIAQFGNLQSYSKDSGADNSEVNAKDNQVVNLDGAISKLQEVARKLRSQIEREGEVDPTSIEECAKEEVRFLELSTQITDLESATKMLKETIAKLNEISKQRFLTTFKGVRDKYIELIPRLFGGGSGDLVLTNPDNPLQTGVEIIVRPPGKKPRTLELLSGGEKALSAAAVVMSMFLNHPSPICVLDEVDAPLDDANLERFLGLIQEISKETQFLMITHNKQSMASVGKLIGVTMQESGVSKAVTVSLEEAESQLEKFVA